MPSFNVELNSRENKDGLYSVFIRYTENRKSRKVKLTFRVEKEHFNKNAKHGKWIRTADAKHKGRNREIEDAIGDLKSRYNDLQKQALPALDYITKKPDELQATITVKSYFDKYLAGRKAETTVGTYNGLVWLLTAFADYVKNETLLSDISTQHIAEYKAFLLSKGNKGSTINTVLRKIHSVFILAVSDDTILKDPFRAHKRVKEVATSRVRLNEDRIKKLSEIKLPNIKQDRVRDYYLFSYYNAGIRIADFMQLRYGNLPDGRLEYEMDKTGHKKSIRLNKESLSILAKYLAPGAKAQDYIFPVLKNSAPYAPFITYEDKRKMSTELRVELNRAVKLNARYINGALKDISDKLELPKAITFHTARHSFADKARKAMKKSKKITLVDIQNSLAHKKISTTQLYWDSLDVESLDEAMGDIFK